MGEGPPFLLGLGSSSKEAGDEGDLAAAIAFAHSSDLSLAKHVHDLVARHAFALPFPGKRSPALL